jgi:hypothetical protein
LAILRKLRNIQTHWQGTALWIVFFAETSHPTYVKAKALFIGWKNYHALSSLLKSHLGGFA